MLVVSLGSTGGLRAADEELAASLGRAGVAAAIVWPNPPAPVRTLMLTDLRWAYASRQATVGWLRSNSARAIVYSTTTAAMPWPRPGAIRFDALSSGNRPGRHGLWQRPLERRRVGQAPLLLPWSEAARGELGSAAAGERTLVLPVPVEPSGESVPRDLAAIAYVAHPAKKGLDRILRAWSVARRPDEELVLVGASAGQLRRLGYAVPADGVRVEPMLPYDDYRALLRRARVFVCAARREDYGIAQLEALADGCRLVTVPSPGPYVALPIARRLDGRLVGEDLTTQLRVALDDPRPGYSGEALRALGPFRRVEADRLVAEELLPRLLPRG